MAYDGFPVVVHYSGNPAKADDVVGEMNGSGGQAIAAHANVAKAADVERLLRMRWTPLAP